MSKEKGFNLLKDICSDIIGSAIFAIGVTVFTTPNEIAPGGVTGIATMLHSIATGNLLPSRVKSICVDINPSTVTKLSDRGSAQVVGIVTDIGTFLPLLYNALKDD